MTFDYQGGEIINVDFDFFDPKESDFHSIKTLLRQLFSSDSEFFELSELTELIVNQPSVGTTVKVDGSESDPFAFLTVLNVNEHKVRTIIAKNVINNIIH